MIELKIKIKDEDMLMGEFNPETCKNQVYQFIKHNQLMVSHQYHHTERDYDIFTLFFKDIETMLLFKLLFKGMYEITE